MLPWHKRIEIQQHSDSVGASTISAGNPFHWLVTELLTSWASRFLCVWIIMPLPLVYIHSGKILQLLDIFSSAFYTGMEFSNSLWWFESQQWSKGCDVSHVSIQAFYLLGYQHWCTCKVDFSSSSSLSIVFFSLILFIGISFTYQFHGGHRAIPPTDNSVPFLCFLDVFLAILLSAFSSSHMLRLFCLMGLLILLFIEILEYLLLLAFIFQWDK